MMTTLICVCVLDVSGPKYSKENKQDDLKISYSVDKNNLLKITKHDTKIITVGIYCH